MKYQKLDSDNHDVSFEEFIIELQNEGEIIIDIYDVGKNGALEYKSTRTFTLAQSNGDNYVEKYDEYGAKLNVGLGFGVESSIFNCMIKVANVEGLYEYNTNRNGKIK